MKSLYQRFGIQHEITGAKSITPDQPGGARLLTVSALTAVRLCTRIKTEMQQSGRNNNVGQGVSLRKAIGSPMRAIDVVLRSTCSMLCLVRPGGALEG